MLGCSFFGLGSKRAPEVVASCFSDGEDQQHYCKAQHVNEDGKSVVTRCIGSQNREAPASLRGKCAEKICSQGSNTDCVVRGDFRVLGQYAELATANMFASDEEAPPAAKPATPAPANAKDKSKNGKAKVAVKPVAAAPAEVDTDPSVHQIVKEPDPTSTVAPAPKKIVSKEPEAEPPSMSITLKPAKAKKKSRRMASVKVEEGFKKICVPKNDTNVPELFRGKCATRSCTGGKCTYKGRKEMFDWASRSTASENE